MTPPDFDRVARELLDSVAERMVATIADESAVVDVRAALLDAWNVGDKNGYERAHAELKRALDEAGVG